MLFLYRGRACTAIIAQSVLLHRLADTMRSSWRSGNALRAWLRS